MNSKITIGTLFLIVFTGLIFQPLSDAFAGQVRGNRLEKNKRIEGGLSAEAIPQSRRVVVDTKKKQLPSAAIHQRFAFSNKKPPSRARQTGSVEGQALAAGLVMFAAIKVGMLTGIFYSLPLGLAIAGVGGVVVGLIAAK